MARTPVRLAPEWDARFTGGIGLSLVLHGVVIAGVVLLAPLAVRRPPPLGAYTVELTDPSALGGRLPPGAITHEIGGGPIPVAGKPPGPVAPPAAEPAQARAEGRDRGQARAEAGASAAEGGARGEARREAEARAAAPAEGEARAGAQARGQAPGEGRRGKARAAGARRKARARGEAGARSAGREARAGDEAGGARDGQGGAGPGERRGGQGRLRARGRALEGAGGRRARGLGGGLRAGRRGRGGPGRRRAGGRPRVPRLPPAGHRHDQEPVDQRGHPPRPGGACALRHRERRHRERRSPRAELGQRRLRHLGRARRGTRQSAAAAAGALRGSVPRVRDRVPLRGDGRTGNRMRARFVLLVLALGLVAGPAGAVVTGAIYGPGSESFRIAVSPLKDLGGGGGLGAEFARALSRDLELSGYFKLIDPKTFVENPETSGITADAIDFTGWAALGAQALVKGGVSAQGGGVTVEVRLFDVPGRKDVPQVGKRFTGGRADVPRMAHKTADAILAYLTGEPGPFDSEIAFVSNRGGRLKDVYLLTFDRDEPVRLTDERSIVGAPEWRPDGRAILFRSYREHFPYLYEIDLASRQVRKLVPGTVPVLNGAWSPDGSRLLVTRDRGGRSEEHTS